MGEKIRILFLSANPPNTGRILVDVEEHAISEKLRQGSVRDNFELFKYSALRAGDLQQHLMNHRPHIVHFSGHGDQDSQEIIVRGERGGSKRLKTKALVEVFNLYRHHVRLIVLNACLTRPAAEALSEVVDYTVGIAKYIGDRAAIKFAGAFYLALSHDMTVPQAFASAMAELKIADARRTGKLELMVRKGIDETKPSPWPVSAPALAPEKVKAALDQMEKVKTALEHLIAGTQTPEETNLVRRQVLDSSLTLEQTEDAAEGEVSVVAPAGGTRAAGSLRAEVNYATYRRMQERLFPPPPGLGPPLPGLIVIGREDSLADVRGLLQQEEADLNLTVVRGWPGVGKTTLVGVLGRDPEVLKTFPDGVLWTSLERHPELMSRLADWGRALDTDELLRTPTVEEAVPKLAALIRHRRMLLIVDDIWNPADALPFLKAAAGSRCALLATTRLPAVAEALTKDERRIYLLPVLSEESALTLLRLLAPSTVEQYPDACRELASDLGYLPLALHVAGRLLRAEAKLGLNIMNLIEDIREGAKLFPEQAPLDRAEGPVLPTVHALFKRSTDDLDEFTRNCFAYLGPFAPKPATFDIPALQAVWEIEDPAPIIRKLVGHGLLEPVGEARFQMHELLVKHARSLLE